MGCIFVKIIEMKIPLSYLIIALISLSALSAKQQEDVEFSCVKKNKASNTCHFNFVVSGAKYRFVDLGCKYEKKREEVIKKAKEGALALAKDWKIDCPAAKDEKEKKPTSGF